MGPLGTASCGPEPLPEDRLYLKEPRRFRFGFLALDEQSLSVDAAAAVLFRTLRRFPLLPILRIRFDLWYYFPDSFQKGGAP